MNLINKSLKKFGNLALITIFINITSLLVDIFMYEFSIFSIVLDSIGVILTLFTGILYLCYSKKSAKQIARAKTLFFTVSIINIFNNLIVWFVSFYVYTLVRAVSNSLVVQSIKNNQYSFFQENAESEETIIIEEKKANSRKDILVKKLEELKSLKNQLLITQEEYQKLREEAIKEFIR